MPPATARPASLALTLAAALGCAAARAPQPAAEPAPFQPPPELRWYRTSAEREVIYAQAYRQATELVGRAAAGVAGPWAVVLDADETVLDNSAYQDRQARLGRGFDPATWDAWVKEKQAVAFPPAQTFIAGVRARGGKVAIVTNRSEAQCPDTRANLVAQGVVADAVLCAPTASGNKQPRFEAVASGAAFGEARPVAVLLFVGDNIQDCPGQTQAGHDADLFGVRCIALPNPMYGSWTSNPYR